jgi:hypothetical protein
VKGRPGGQTPAGSSETSSKTICAAEETKRRYLSSPRGTVRAQGSDQRERVVTHGSRYNHLSIGGTGSLQRFSADASAGNR